MRRQRLCGPRSRRATNMQCQWARILYGACSKETERLIALPWTTRGSPNGSYGGRRPQRSYEPHRPFIGDITQASLIGRSERIPGALASTRYAQKVFASNVTPI